MKKITSIVTLSLAFAIAITCGCRKSEKSREIIDPEKTYTGILLGGDCPSYAFIQVTNADIGDDWTWGTKHHNVIGISNWPDSISANQSVSFKLNPSADKIECQIQRPCAAVTMVGEYPKQIYCSSSVTATK